MPKRVQKPSDWILSTKLNPPLIRSDIVDRPQLLERLERQVRRPLTVIAAPAGYGKSTLAAQWLESGSLPGVWISLDEGDNEPRSFLGYLVAALRGREAKACAGIHELLDAPQLPPSEVIAKLLANDLEAIEEPFLLVLDDYHLLSDPEIHDLLERLLQHPPRSLHLVILTRRYPPFPVATMKARGLAVEIRASDLQFDEAETGQVLERVGQIHLDEAGLARVMAEIEGWITGLRLFCLASEKGEDPKVYLFGMSGGATHVEDYLVEQVLSQQVPEILECLLETSILDRFCAPLCEAVCKASPGSKGRKGVMTGRKFMETIAAGSLFGIQLEPGGEWIRYHHLFRELLCSHLRRSWDPQDIAELHRRAAQWFCDKGLIEEGLKHAMAAGDPDLAARMIEDNRLEAINADRWARLGQWLDALPPGVENSRPHLLMTRAYLLLHSIRRIQAIPPLLDKVVALEGESPEDPMLVGELHFFRGIPALRLGELEVAKRHFGAALQSLPETNEEARSVSEMYGYLIQHLQGRGNLAVEGLREVIRLSRPRSLHYKGRLVFGLSYIHALAGRWPESHQAAGQLLELIRASDPSFAVAWGVYMQGNASLQMLDLEEADRCSAQSFGLRYLKNSQAAIDAIVGRALGCQLQGRDGDADEVLREAREFARWTGDPAKIDVVDSGRARVALLRGDVDAAARWLEACHLKPDLPVRMFFLEYPEITACRVLVARGTPDCLDQAAAQLERLEQESRRFHHDCQLLPVLVLKSLLHSKRAERKEALGVIAEAIDLAWPGRWLLPFVEAGPAMAEVLRQVPENPAWGDFIQRTLTRFDSGRGTPRVQAPEPGAGESLIEDLTNRETDVLALLCERLYDKEIAERLGVSISTIKTHLSHIYGKLGVTNRREATREARRLRLV